MISKAPNTAETVQTMTIQSTDRAGNASPSRCLRASAMPVTSNVTTSGITVILSAFSHKVPTKPATPSAPSCAPGERRAALIPRTRPSNERASAQ